MRLKKRYIPIMIAAGLFGLSRLPAFSMRKSEKKQTEYLKNKGVNPQYGQYETQKQKVHYTKVSDCEDKPVLILIHGSPGSSSSYLDYLSDVDLRKEMQIIAVDRPGFGYSGYGKAECSLEKQAAAFYPILEKYQDQKVILVGHSYGGPVITRMAMDYPNLVDGLIMVAGSVCADLEPKEWWRPYLSSALIRWIIPPPLRVSNTEIEPLWKELELMEPHWTKITCPVTIFQGEKDNLVPKENADYAHEQLVNSKKVDMQIIEGGNHFILWSMQKEIVRKIKKMIDDFQLPTPNCTET